MNLFPRKGQGTKTLHSFSRLNSLNYWKRYKIPADYAIFSNPRKQCKAIIYTDEDKYIASIESNITKAPKYFWQFTKALSITNSYPTSMKLQNQSSSDPSVIANLFAKYFESIYKTPTIDQSVAISVKYQNLLFQMSFTSNEVLVLLNGLNTNKDAGRALTIYQIYLLRNVPSIWPNCSR